MSVAVSLPDPIQIAPPTGSSTLPIVELPKPLVEGDRKRTRLRKGSKKRQESDCSFGNFVGTLDFTAWSFFHAAKKTELTTSFTTSLIDRRALSFAAEYDGVFVWDAINLRRADRSVFGLEDFADSGLAGRCGEAIAYLTMVKWGYVFWDRIATLWERAATRSGMTHPEMVRQAAVIASRLSSRPDLSPDFAFEKADTDVALMEAKGSFVHPVRDDPTTKDDLRHGLKQLAAWSGMIAPPPRKSFVIGTYLRDRSDATGDPSLIAFVDPDGDNDASISPVELPPDWIRRGNYGAWLIGMGFPESGSALREGREISPPEQLLSVLTVGGRDYAVTFQRVRVKRNRFPGLPFPSPWFEFWYHLDEVRHHPQLVSRVLRDMGVGSIEVMGVEVRLLRQIGEAVLNSASNALMEIQLAAALAEQPSADGFNGSVLPDGTLLGQVEPELLANLRTERFQI